MSTEVTLKQIAELLERMLTMIRQPVYEVGRKGAEKMAQHIEEEDELIKNIEIVANMASRKSCCCTG